MSTFTTAVQDFVDAIRQGAAHEEVMSCLQRAVDANQQLSREEAQWGILGLVEMLAQPDTHYPALVAVVCERCMASGGDAWAPTGLIVERLHDALVRGPRFERACAERLRQAGDVPDEEKFALQRQVAEGMLTEAVCWAELDIWCQCAAGLLYSFPEARRLFRYLGGTPEMLDGLKGLRDGPGELAQVLRDQPEADVPADFPRGPVDAVLAQLDTALARGDQIIPAIQDLYRALFAVDLATRHYTLGQLGQRIRTCDVAHAGDLTQLCGSLVETGGDPSAAIEAILARLPGVLADAVVFQEAALDLARERGVDLETEDLLEVVERFGNDLVEEMPAAANAWQSSPTLCLGTIAHLSRLPAKRQEAQGRRDLLDPAATLAGTFGPANFLTKMLRVLDGEEIVVLAPEQRLGFRVRVDGIGDNFQLHTLLAGVIVGPAEQGLYPGLAGVSGGTGNEEQVPGRPLDRRAVGVARDLPCTGREATVWSRLQLWTYEALGRDGKLPGNAQASSDYFVWNEGVPADIPAFEGTRVVLLGEAPYSRSWNGGRIFQGMLARCDLVERMPTAEVEGWLSRIRQRG